MCLRTDIITWAIHNCSALCTYAYMYTYTNLCRAESVSIRNAQFLILRHADGHRGPHKCSSTQSRVPTAVVDILVYCVRVLETHNLYQHMHVWNNLHIRGICWIEGIASSLLIWSVIFLSAGQPFHAWCDLNLLKSLLQVKKQGCNVHVCTHHSRINAHMHTRAFCSSHLGPASATFSVDSSPLCI